MDRGARITPEINDKLLLNTGDVDALEVLFRHGIKITPENNNLISLNSYPKNILVLLFNNGFQVTPKNNNKLMLYTYDRDAFQILFDNGARITPEINDKLILQSYDSKLLSMLFKHGARITPENNDRLLLKKSGSEYFLRIFFNNGARITPEINDQLMLNVNTKGMLQLLLDNGATIPKGAVSSLIKKFKGDTSLVKKIIANQRKESYNPQLFNVYKGNEHQSHQQILKKCTPDKDLMSSYEYTDPDFDEDVYIIRDDNDRDTYRCYTLAEMKYMLEHDRKDMMRQIHVMSSDNIRNNELWEDARNAINANFNQKENYCEYLTKISKNASDKKKVLECLNYVTSDFAYRDSINWLMGPIESQFRGRGVDTPLTIENLQTYINYLQEYMNIHFDSLSELNTDEAVTYVASTILDYIVNSGNDRGVVFNNLNVAFDSLKAGENQQRSPSSRRTRRR